MTILSRGIGESVIIDKRISVTVTQISGDKVRLCVSAPPEIRIDREAARNTREYSEYFHTGSFELAGADVGGEG